LKRATTEGVGFHPFFLKPDQTKLKKALMLNFSSRLPVFLIVMTLALAACGKPGAKGEASQVAAKVNGAEISVHQINQVLEGTPGVTTANAGEASKEILEKLIMQEIAVSRATESKLDRTPEVIMALDAARREILAQAYFNRVAGAPGKVSNEEIKHYFNEHPELFTQRRIYSLVDIEFARDEKLIAPLRDLVARNKSMNEITRWLGENGTTFTANTDTRAAENLSLEVLPKVMKLREGQSDVFEAGPAVHIINLVSSRQEPVDLATASPQIERFLIAQSTQQLVTGEMKKLRDAAKVEYFGEFAPDKKQ
jgi:EpsD family peptidyl-prolyl cis-trans isomerase